MEIIDLDVKVRKHKGSRFMRRLRAGGRVPGVLYGGDRDPLSVSLDGKALEELLKQGARMVKLKMGSDDQRALLKEVQHDVLGDHILHVDFHRVVMGQAMDVTVPVILVGTAKGVREGGMLQQRMDMVDIRCTPEAIPEKIEVDVTELESGQVLVGDIPLPEGVAIAKEADKSLSIASLTFKEEAAEEPAEGEGEDEAQPEIIKKGKDEEDEG